MREVNTLIIGAGISGLTYAAFTEKDYLIVEKENQVGGLCRTFYQDGYIWDYAGHFFHFANPQIKSFFENKISADDMVICNKNTNINYNGQDIDYPFQMNIHQLNKEEFIDCLYDLFHRNEKNKYLNFEDMLYGKFGKSITEKFLKPYNEKLYACDLNELDTDAMGRFFPYADQKQIIDNMKINMTQTYNSTFDYPKKGAQYFIDIIYEKINKEKLLLNSTLQSLDINNKTALINGEEIHFNKLVNTMPLNHFVHFLPEKMNIIKNLSCNKVLVFNLGFDKPSVDSKIHWTYVPMKDINFYRFGFYNNILGTEKLSMYVEIGYREKDVVDEKKQLQLTLENLRNLGVIDNHKLVCYNSIIIDPGYVHITDKSIKAVNSLRDELKKNNIFTIGRYGKWTYCSIEDCMVEAINLSKNID